MRIAITGCGPAGLLAAHAAKLYGFEVDIYSLKRKSEHGGAQYLHRAIEKATGSEPDLFITYLKVGTSAGYAEKVYGDPFAPVSWDLFEEGVVPAWSMALTYEKLWEMYGEEVQHCRIDPTTLARLIDRYDLVISTVPKMSICRCQEDHRFDSQRIILTPDSKLEARNTIVYNGQPEDNWYRTSDIGGYQWTEYSAEAAGPPIVGERHLGFKPTGNDCDCWTGKNVHFLGRFGAWRRGVLAHHAFEEADDMLSTLTEVQG